MSGELTDEKFAQLQFQCDETNGNPAEDEKEEEEKAESVSELPNFRPQEDTDEYYIQPGTTPPKCERQIR